MLQLPDTTDPVEYAFNNASRALVEMQESLEKMKVKYGTGSHFYQRQQFLFDCMVEMQEVATKEINALRSAYRLADVGSRAKDLIIASLETRVPVAKLLEIYG